MYQSLWEASISAVWRSGWDMSIDTESVYRNAAYKQVISEQTILLSYCGIQTISSVLTKKKNMHQITFRNITDAYRKCHSECLVS